LSIVVFNNLPVFFVRFVVDNYNMVTFSWLDALIRVKRHTHKMQESPGSVALPTAYNADAFRTVLIEDASTAFRQVTTRPFTPQAVWQCIATLKAVVPLRAWAIPFYGTRCASCIRMSGGGYIVIVVPSAPPLVYHLASFTVFMSHLIHPVLRDTVGRDFPGFLVSMKVYIITLGVALPIYIPLACIADGSRIVRAVHSRQWGWGLV